MVNLLSWGVAHLNTHMNNHTDEDMRVGTSESNVAIKGTLVSVKPSYGSQGVKIIEPLYHILVETSTLIEKRIQLYRGIRIFVGSRIFVITLDPGGIPEEQYKTRTVIVCKELMTISDPNF